MKFNQIGQDPLQPGVPLNLIEQVNQTFTYLVTAAAVKALLLAHPESAPFEANLGTASGTDIESVAHPKVAAEVFAAVSPANNQKLKQDIAKVQAVKADLRYVFYCSPGAHDEGKVPGDVRVKVRGRGDNRREDVSELAELKLEVRPRRACGEHVAAPAPKQLNGPPAAALAR